MKTEELLKVKYVLVCAWAFYYKEGKPPDIPVEKILIGISQINQELGFNEGRGTDFPKSRQKNYIKKVLKYQSKIA